jgi:hypothetical protein
MVPCFSCHTLCQETKTYRVYYGIESFKPYAAGNYDQYNKKAISKKVVYDEVSICGDCAIKVGQIKMRRYAVKLWSAGVTHAKKIKLCEFFNLFKIPISDGSLSYKILQKN